AHALCIEADERHEHEIELPRTDPLRFRGLEDAQRIWSHRSVGCREMHASLAAVDEARQIDESRMPPHELEERCDIELLGKGGVEGDALARTQRKAALYIERDAPFGLGSDWGRNPSPPRAQLRAKRLTLRGYRGV